jgi:hypothetical protein
MTLLKAICWYVCTYVWYTLIMHEIACSWHFDIYAWYIIVMMHRNDGRPRKIHKLACMRCMYFPKVARRFDGLCWISMEVGSVYVFRTTVPLHCIALAFTRVCVIYNWLRYSVNGFMLLNWCIVIVICIFYY